MSSVSQYCVVHDRLGGIHEREGVHAGAPESGISETVLLQSAGK